MNSDIPLNLLETVQHNSFKPPSSNVSLLINDIMENYGDAVQAILFYGSCFHEGEDLDGLFDLYVIVSSYFPANRNCLHAVANKLLPPNVFYLEAPGEKQTIRAKYALLSLNDLQKGTSKRWFHSYLWARFCQPTALVYARNEKVAEQVNKSFSQAILTFVNRVLPSVSQEFTTRELWSKGLELTYRCEFRTEQADKQVRLFDATPEYFEDITSKGLDSSPYQVKEIESQGASRYRAIIPSSVRVTSRITWTVRIVQGKILSALRLIKGSLTFEGGVDYILWKIKRHSGVTLEVSPFLRRHPLLAMCFLSWRLYRRGGIQ